MRSYRHERNHDMKCSVATVAALTLLAFGGHGASIAHADKTNATPPEPTTTSDAEKGGTDDGLKSIEQGFSIPAADGASGKNEKPNKGSDKK